jgi:Pretoxin HINT domain
MATIRVEGETIRATGGHPFWVVDGEDLAERRLPERISAYEVGGRQPGRWVLAVDLRAGDKILRRDGVVSALDSVEVDETEETVYNFRVFELENYAVGRCGVLVHNTNTATPTAPKSASGRMGSLSDNGYGQPYGTPAPNTPKQFQGTDKPWTTGATPNSTYTHIDPKTGRAVQNAIYDQNGNVIGHVDFKNHGPGALSGHGHQFPQPGNPASGHGAGKPHIPNNQLPPGWDTLPPGVQPQKPIGQ